MALVSTDVIVVPTSTVSDFLYDSGWKMVNGTGSVNVLETLSYTSDSIIHVFGRRWGNSTRGDEWTLTIPYGTGIISYTYWRSLNDNRATPINTELNAYWEYKLAANYNQITNATHPTVRGNAQGMPLAAGLTSYFQSQPGATSTDGMQYRIVVERSTSAVMVAR